jgi:LysR family transcriptional regulator, hydrogen peroxide-inducible genes activator
MSITLKQLRYFDALAREKHFGRAAELCSVTQPALSMQIHELEETLGIILVERTRNGVRLTAKGSALAERSTRILGEVRDFEAFAKHSQRTLTGPLRFGVIPTLAPYILPPLLPLVRDAYPELELNLRETQTHQLTDDLLEGKLDVLLMALPVNHNDLETEELFHDRFVLALPKDRHLSGKVKATKEMVEQERLLLLEEGHCLRDQALSYCTLQHVDNVNTFGASSLSTIVEMVAAGFGITLLPEISIGVEQRGRGLTLLPFAEPEPFRTIGLVWRSTSPRKDEFKALGHVIKRAALEGPMKAAQGHMTNADGSARGAATSAKTKTVTKAAAAKA